MFCTQGIANPGVSSIMLVPELESNQTLMGAQCSVASEWDRFLPQYLVSNGFSHVALLARLIIQPVGLHI